MSLKLIQIVPTLPPAISGVGDYAHLLARRLLDEQGIDTHFLACHGEFPGGFAIGGFPVTSIERRSSHELAQMIERQSTSNIAMLHYVGYGYQARGCPLWLLRGLQDWKRQDQRRRLVVMFHELFAWGPPWRSSFWNSPLQRWLVKRLAFLSDHAATNLCRSQEILRRMTAPSKSAFSVLPVFSNVGEPRAVANLRLRKPRLIVFGGAAWRRSAYIEHRPSLERACRALGIDEVIDIGAPCADLPTLSLRRIEKGNVTAAELSGELIQAQAGFFTYPVPFLGKSGIFAAYAAHGLVPVTYPGNGGANQDGLHSGEHFFAELPAAKDSTKYLEAVATAAHAWYQQHRIQVHACHFGKVLNGMASVEAQLRDAANDRANRHQARLAALEPR